jgi:hypothetical protein
MASMSRSCAAADAEVGQVTGPILDSKTVAGLGLSESGGLPIAVASYETT